MKLSKPTCLVAFISVYGLSLIESHSLALTLNETQYFSCYELFCKRTAAFANEYGRNCHSNVYLPLEIGK